MNDHTPDLFGHTQMQGDLFGRGVPQAPRLPQVNPQVVRARLNAMLADMRAAETRSPWTAETTRLNQLLFPQMSNWLPEEERAQLCMEFEQELKRLRLAA